MQYGIFISHSWKHSHHYDTLASWIFEENWQTGNGVVVEFVDLSVPKDDPIHFARNDAELQAAIYSKISRSSVVVIPTGMYATHSKWIGKEITGSNLYGKPILAVNPWAQEKKSSIVQAAAKETCGWNQNSVAQGIWRLCRT
ncbi:TIR domain-containing protein [Hyphomonas sp.]|uniref:TIR domain-containing protein n=1 Tax=Hyphomonas sp. TaxID=87 RepID=UPI0032424CC0